MKTVINNYIAVKRTSLEKIAGPAFVDKYLAVDAAKNMAGPENSDYAIIKVHGIVQALIETKYVEKD